MPALFKTRKKRESQANHADSSSESKSRSLSDSVSTSPPASVVNAAVTKPINVVASAANQIHNLGSSMVGHPDQQPNSHDNQPSVPAPRPGSGAHPNAASGAVAGTISPTNLAASPRTFAGSVAPNPGNHPSLQEKLLNSPFQEEKVFSAATPSASHARQPSQATDVSVGSTHFPHLTPLGPSDTPWAEYAIQRAAPAPRFGHSANYLAARDGELFIMGGIRDMDILNDLWVIDTRTLTGYQLMTEGHRVGPRVGHAALALGNAHVVFGGDTKIDETDPLDDNLYLLNTSSLKWTVAQTQGPRPSGRYGHSLSNVGARVYVFGGQVDEEFYDDMWSFDLTSWRSPTAHWERVYPQSKPPPPRTNHTVVTYEDKLYLFGGANGDLWYSDTWRFDPVTLEWEQLECSGYVPAPCQGHAATIIGDVMYVFGGMSSQGQLIDQLFALKLSTLKWYTFQNLGPGPSPRSGHSLTAFGGDKVLVWGGSDHGNTAYVLDVSRINYPEETPVPAQVGFENPTQIDAVNESISEPMNAPSSLSHQQPNSPPSRQLGNQPISTDAGHSRSQSLGVDAPLPPTPDHRPAKEVRELQPHVYASSQADQRGPTQARSNPVARNSMLGKRRSVLIPSSPVESPQSLPPTVEQQSQSQDELYGMPSVPGLNPPRPAPAPPAHYAGYSDLGSGAPGSSAVPNVAAPTVPSAPVPSSSAPPNSVPPTPLTAQSAVSSIPTSAAPTLPSKSLGSEERFVSATELPARRSTFSATKPEEPAKETLQQLEGELKGMPGSLPVSPDLLASSNLESDVSLDRSLSADRSADTTKSGLRRSHPQTNLASTIDGPKENVIGLSNELSPPSKSVDAKLYSPVPPQEGDQTTEHSLGELSDRQPSITSSPKLGTTEPSHARKVSEVNLDSPKSDFNPVFVANQVTLPSKPISADDATSSKVVESRAELEPKKTDSAKSEPKKSVEPIELEPTKSKDKEAARENTLDSDKLASATSSSAVVPQAPSTQSREVVASATDLSPSTATAELAALRQEVDAYRQRDFDEELHKLKQTKIEQLREIAELRDANADLKRHQSNMATRSSDLEKRHDHMVGVVDTHMATLQSQQEALDEANRQLQEQQESLNQLSYLQSENADLKLRLKSSEANEMRAKEELKVSNEAYQALKLSHEQLLGRETSENDSKLLSKHVDLQDHLKGLTAAWISFKNRVDINDHHSDGSNQSRGFGDSGTAVNGSTENEYKLQYENQKRATEQAHAELEEMISKQATLKSQLRELSARNAASHSSADLEELKRQHRTELATQKKSNDEKFNSREEEHSLALKQIQNQYATSQKELEATFLSLQELQGRQKSLETANNELQVEYDKALTLSRNQEMAVNKMREELHMSRVQIQRLEDQVQDASLQNASLHGDSNADLSHTSVSSRNDQAALVIRDLRAQIAVLEEEAQDYRQQVITLKKKALVK